jgi:hypothetical protein
MENPDRSNNIPNFPKPQPTGITTNLQGMEIIFDDSGDGICIDDELYTVSPITTVEPGEYYFSYPTVYGPETIECVTDSLIERAPSILEEGNIYTVVNTPGYDADALLVDINSYPVEEPVTEEPVVEQPEVTEVPSGPITIRTGGYGYES